jgi:hypothetical protein
MISPSSPCLVIVSMLILCAGPVAARPPAAPGAMESGAEGPPGPPPWARREVSEQEHAMRRREAGQLRPFDELLARARSVGQGEYLGVEPDLATSTYRFKFLRPGANVIWVDVDGRTGQIVSAR